MNKKIKLDEHDIIELKILERIGRMDDRFDNIEYRIQKLERFVKSKPKQKGYKSMYDKVEQ